MANTILRAAVVSILFVLAGCGVDQEEQRVHDQTSDPRLDDSMKLSNEEADALEAGEQAATGGTPTIACPYVGWYCSTGASGYGFKVYVYGCSWGYWYNRTNIGCRRY